MTTEQEAIATFLNYYLSVGTIIVGIIGIVWLYALAYEWKTKGETRLLSWIGRHALPLGFFISLGGVLITMFYSDYLGILPCGLCWFQRIFLYSQLFIYGLAWYKNDRKIFDYTILLSSVGLIIAMYHHYLQIGYSALLPCPVVASTIDCAKPTFIEFGFVTLPLMSVALFIVLMAIALTAERKWKNN